MIKKISLRKMFPLLGLLGVLVGAFGAHELKTAISPGLLEYWKTATLYLFVHVLAGLYSVHFASRARSGYLFLFGIIIFSGSLYTLVLTKQTYWGMVTPFGGIMLIFGWLLLIFDTKKQT